jgi:hypothetical protein
VFLPLSFLSTSALFLQFSSDDGEKEKVTLVFF